MLQTSIFTKKHMDYRLLSISPLFSGLTIAETKLIMSRTPYALRRFKAGAIITQSGEPVNYLMVVLSGTVKGEMIDYAGRLIKIEEIQAPGALAAAFLFGDKNRFPVNVVAVIDTELLLVEKPDFLKLLRANDRILVNFLDMISNRSQFLSEKIKFLNFKTIRGKLAQYILQKAGQERNEIILDMTQNDLADFFGVARPSVARAIRDLKDDGYLKSTGKKISILNKKGLGDLIAD
jgi:CRP-like cAMP-binding protein